MNIYIVLGVTVVGMLGVALPLVQYWDRKDARKHAQSHRE